MPTLDEYKGQQPAWCPGCGNFSILRSFKEAMVEMGIAPHQFTIVSGIGQSSKFPHYVRCNTFNGLHGRALPVATGIRLANHEHPVMVFTGDGDCYGEGGNHLIHAIRRNINVKLFVHDNQIYGLTKGQASPTSMEGMKTKNQPFGVFSEQLNPMQLCGKGVFRRKRTYKGTHQISRESQGVFPCRYLAALCNIQQDKYP
jgi:2-oxoglutarate ferredoxin oxidoreductase subunit beta